MQFVMRSLLWQINVEVFMSISLAVLFHVFIREDVSGHWVVINERFNAKWHAF